MLADCRPKEMAPFRSIAPSELSGLKAVGDGVSAALLDGAVVRVDARDGSAGARRRRLTCLDELGRAARARARGVVARTRRGPRRRRRGAWPAGGTLRELLAGGGGAGRQLAWALRSGRSRPHARRRALHGRLGARRAALGELRVDERWEPQLAELGAMHRSRTRGARRAPRARDAAVAAPPPAKTARSRSRRPTPSSRPRSSRARAVAAAGGPRRRRATTPALCAELCDPLFLPALLTPLLSGDEADPSPPRPPPPALLRRPGATCSRSASASSALLRPRRRRRRPASPARGGGSRSTPTRSRARRAAGMPAVALRLARQCADADPSAPVGERRRRLARVAARVADRRPAAAAAPPAAAAAPPPRRPRRRRRRAAGGAGSGDGVGRRRSAAAAAAAVADRDGRRRAV